MATSRDEDAGRLILSNATPFLWKRSAKGVKGMSKWTFPEHITPGETVTVLVAFAGRKGPHASVSYQVSKRVARSHATAAAAATALLLRFLILIYNASTCRALVYSNSQFCNVVVGQVFDVYLLI